LGIQFLHQPLRGPETLRVQLLAQQPDIGMGQGVGETHLAKRLADALVNAQEDLSFARSFADETLVLRLPRGDELPHRKQTPR
jgi:hypothetical protein